MSFSPLVKGLPQLRMDENQYVPTLFAQPAYTLERLIFQGVHQKAAGFYYNLRLPDHNEIYMLEADNVAWAFEMLAKQPGYLSTAMHHFMVSQDPSLSHIVDTHKPEQVLGLLSSLMARRKIMLRNDSDPEALRALTWRSNGLPFMRQHTMRTTITRLQGSDTACQQRGTWMPKTDPHSRILLAINHWQVLVDLQENFAALVSGKNHTSQCKQFNSRDELSSWLHRITGEQGLVQALPWNKRLQLPHLSCLSDLREWTRHLQPADHNFPPAQMQLGFQNDSNGVWEWLGGQAAFCEPVRHKLQGNQEDNHSLRLQILLHQTGSLIHPGYPEQPHRMDNEAPGMEFYRPVNPFKGDANEQGQ